MHTNFQCYDKFCMRSKEGKNLMDVLMANQHREISPGAVDGLSDYERGKATAGQRVLYIVKRLCKTLS